MEPPSSTYAEAIRDEQAKVLRTIRPVERQRRGARAVPRLPRRAGRGEGLAGGDVRGARLHVDSWRWERRAVLRARRQVPEDDATEVFVELKTPPQVVFREADAVGRQLRALPAQPAGRDRGRRARQAPRRRHGGRTRRARRDVRRHAKRPAGRLRAAARRRDGRRRHALRAPGRRRGGVGDCRSADAHEPSTLFEYEPGSWGPPQADQLVADVGGWNTPQ